MITALPLFCFSLFDCGNVVVKSTMCGKEPYEETETVDSVIIYLFLYYYVYKVVEQDRLTVKLPTHTRCLCHVTKLRGCAFVTGQVTDSLLYEVKLVDEVLLNYQSSVFHQD